MEKKYDMINHPRHYISKHGLEVIDVIAEFTDSLSGIVATDTGNVIKYILRWPHKGGVEDLKKARFYINHLINLFDEEETSDTNNNESVDISEMSDEELEKLIREMDKEEK